MEDAKPIYTPIRMSSMLGMDELDPSINETMCIGIIGSLFYLTTNRLDIMFSMGMRTRF